MSIVLFLPDIRSVFNVASLFRTADGAGVERIILGGYTPGPLDRFGRPRKDFAKVSLGAEAGVSWERAEQCVERLQALRAEGYTCVVLEQDERSIKYCDFRAMGDVVLVVGNEVEGVSAEVRDIADIIISIPMSGKKESLNVEVAAAIALFSLRDSQ